MKSENVTFNYGFNGECEKTYKNVKCDVNVKIMNIRTRFCVSLSGV